jgi:FlaG/FlaF family flagellin (archaellin)
MTTDETGGNSQQSRGVSPAISVVLAVAITLVLAATVGAFVLGLGENTSEGPPSLSLSADQQGDRIILTHEAGETINTTNLRLTGVKGWGPSAQEFGAGDQISGTPKPGAERVDIVFETEDSASILRTADVSNIEVSSLVVNDHFERGTGEEADGWELSDTGTGAVRTDERSLSGEYSVKQVDFISDYSRDITSEPVDVTLGQNYSFGGSYYLEGTNNESEDYDYYVTITWLDGDGNKVSNQVPPTNTGGSKFQAFNEWTETVIKEAPYSAPQDAEQAELEIRSRDNGNEDTDVYWDDMFIEPTNYQFYSPGGQ